MLACQARLAVAAGLRLGHPGPEPGHSRVEAAGFHPTVPRARRRSRGATGSSAAMGTRMGTRMGTAPNTRPSRKAPGGPFRAQETGRGGAIRTLDLLNPIQVRYQAAPRPGDGQSTKERGHPERGDGSLSAPCHRALPRSTRLTGRTATPCSQPVRGLRRAGAWRQVRKRHDTATPEAPEAACCRGVDARMECGAWGWHCGESGTGPHRFARRSGARAGARAETDGNAAP